MCYSAVPCASVTASNRPRSSFYFFFFNDTATTEIYTLSLHDALPISRCLRQVRELAPSAPRVWLLAGNQSRGVHGNAMRSEEHTSELQSQSNLVCRLLLEKKNKHRRARLSQCP